MAPRHRKKKRISTPDGSTKEKERLQTDTLHGDSSSIQLEYERRFESWKDDFDEESDVRESLDSIVRKFVHPTGTTSTEEHLIFMVLGVYEEESGLGFSIWGCTENGKSVLLKVKDFEQYFYIPAPRLQENPDVGDTSEQRFYEFSIESEHSPNRVRQDEYLEEIRNMLNRYDESSELSIQRIELVHGRPMLYYRPDAPDGAIFLKCYIPCGGNARKAGSSVLKAISNEKNKTLGGWFWSEFEIYESEVSPLQRFLTDVPCSGGAWLYIPALAKVENESKKSHQKRISAHKYKQNDSEGFLITQNRVSRADIEGEVTSWRCITCLSPDATQLTDHSWSPLNDLKSSVRSRIQAPLRSAMEGYIPALRIMTIDVCLGTDDGKDRCPVPSNGDPVLAISCVIELQTKHQNDKHYSPSTNKNDSGTPSKNKTHLKKQRKSILQNVDLVFDPDINLEDDNTTNPKKDSISVVSTETSQDARDRHGGISLPEKAMISFVYAQNDQEKNTFKYSKLRDKSYSADVVFCNSEQGVLLMWYDFFEAFDPDVMVTFQLRDTLAAIQQRWETLGLPDNSLHLSRYLPKFSKPLSVRKITTYSAAWVRSQSRMSSTSNQETFRADEVEGRVVMDLLRHIISTYNLASFTLADSVQSILGETFEVMPAYRASLLSGFVSMDYTDQENFSPKSRYRLARYSLNKVKAIRSLLWKVSSLIECIEMARITGLTLEQVLYKAQMIRTWSLLLRAAKRASALIPDRPETQPLKEHTFIFHPVESGTTGLYQEPVAILDFVSLYPSIFIAYNLCYSTLLHPDDVESVQDKSTFTSPCGSKFVTKEVRGGILPGILAALISARVATKEKLNASTDLAERSVLDCRQKALKVTANALYGFTGALASPLQSSQIADSCLAIGADCCRKSKQIIEDASAEGKLGKKGKEAKIIYGHTDSLFVHFSKANCIEDAIKMGIKASNLVSEYFPEPLQLKFERVCSPFMLLHVNRYAGRSFAGESDVQNEGQLVVKGIRSTWRQSAPYIQHTLHGCLTRILMHQDVDAALNFAEERIDRLLSGKVEVFDLVMTGGLWRVTGEQIESAAATDDRKTTSKDFKEGQERDEIRGPHASLAVKLSRRDPGRRFVLGERIQYVLTAGHRLQDEAAEDPLLAAKDEIALDYGLYCRNKLQNPLKEILGTCASSDQLKELFHGSDTRNRTRGIRPDSFTGQLSGPSSPTSSPSPGKSKKRQLGLTSFFKTRTQCLACHKSLEGQDDMAIEEIPGLCRACSNKEGTWGKAWLDTMHEASRLEANFCASYAVCRGCHSGLMHENILCENSECPVTYTRISNKAALQRAHINLKRIDKSCV